MEQNVPGYGFLDNISLTLAGGGTPATTTTPPATTDPIEGTWDFSGDIVVIKRRTASTFEGWVVKPRPRACGYAIGQPIWTITALGGLRYTGNHTHMDTKRGCVPDSSYPAAWDLAISGTRVAMRLCVTAKDGYKACFDYVRQAPPSGRDDVPPYAKALAGSGSAGTAVRLRYQASDDTGIASKRIALYQGSTAVFGGKTPFGPALEGKAYYVVWNAPTSAAGSYRLCVSAVDQAGNASGTSCAALTINP